MDIFRIIGIVVVALIAVPVILHFVLALLGLTFGLLFLTIRIAVLAAIVYVVYMAVRAIAK